MTEEAIAKLNSAAEYGYVTKHHSLFPEAFNDYCPALNIMTQKAFDKLVEENSKEPVVNKLYLVGSLNYWEDYVNFFGSFQHDHAIYTKLSLHDMERYQLPYYFLKMLKTFYHPEDFRWHHDELFHGKSETTVIVVLGDGDFDAKIYKWN